MPDDGPAHLSSSFASRSSAPSLDPTIRPRNRRLASALSDFHTNPEDPASLTSPPSLESLAGRDKSPIPAARIGGGSRASSRVHGVRLESQAAGKPPSGRGLLEGSWTSSWASVQGFASSVFNGLADDSLGASRSSSHTQRSSTRDTYGSSSKRLPDSWGPAPPELSNPKLHDVAAGALAQRESDLKAMKTRSVLESHENVNGGLDVAGKFKRRKSDEFTDTPNLTTTEDEEDCLAYIHEVRPQDTYAGIILRYRCQEQAFRKANGMWSRDIQVRKHLTIPVDACEIKGRPCEGPSFFSNHVDHLAPTPDVSSAGLNASANDYFANERIEHQVKVADDTKPWTHVRWVKLDSCQEPVEIARVSRKAMGFFPPRRKKSLHTVSTLSTPRESLDIPTFNLNGDVTGSPSGSVVSTRHSLLTSRPPHALGTSPSASLPIRSRAGSDNDDARPAWMRRPGGVGSLSRSVRAPGPDKDALNSWTRKHLPGLNIDFLPSMSVMGSESARFGFGSSVTTAADGASTAASATIVESPFEDGRDVGATRGGVGAGAAGTGLDKAAASIETWLRGAWAKRPGTPVLGPMRARQLAEDGDLIELEDTNSDDGRGGGGLMDAGSLGSSLLNSSFGSSGRTHGDDGMLRGRSTVLMGKDKGKKAE